MTLPKQDHLQDVTRNILMTNYIKQQHKVAKQTQETHKQ